MSISKNIAAAVIAPAAIAGVVLSSGSAASAATVHQAAHDKYHQWVTVRAGDTLSKIAAAHHMSWEALYMAPPNRSRIHDPNVVIAGERLRIPADPKLWASKFVAPQAPAQSAAGQAAPQGASAQGSTAQGSTAQGSAPASQPAAGASSSGAGSSFQQCVAYRESGNNPTASSAGLYGILPSTWSSLGYSGTAGQASVAQQTAAFNQLYAKDGTAPWAPYDGC
jgi:LysM repeat protein